MQREAALDLEDGSVEPTRPCIEQGDLGVEARMVATHPAQAPGGRAQAAPIVVRNR